MLTEPSAAVLNRAQVMLVCKWVPSRELSGKCCFSSSKTRMSSAGVFLLLMASSSFTATVAPGTDTIPHGGEGGEGREGRGREGRGGEGREGRGGEGKGGEGEEKRQRR